MAGGQAVPSDVPRLRSQAYRVNTGPMGQPGRVRKGTLVTPHVTEEILEGLTRTTVFELVKAEGISVLERPINPSEQFIADEAFLAGTASQIAHGTRVDRPPVGTGSPDPISTRLQDIHFRAAGGDDPRYRGWLTPIY